MAETEDSLQSTFSSVHSSLRANWISACVSVYVCVCVCVVSAHTRHSTMWQFCHFWAKRSIPPSLCVICKNRRGARWLTNIHGENSMRERSVSRRFDSRKCVQIIVERTLIYSNALNERVWTRIQLAKRCSLQSKPAHTAIINKHIRLIKQGRRVHLLWNLIHLNANMSELSHHRRCRKQNLDIPLRTGIIADSSANATHNKETVRIR